MNDHAFLKPFGTVVDVEILCHEAREYGFAIVAINPAEVQRCVQLLHGSTVRGSAAVGPTMGVKASGGIRTLEAARALIAAGATRLGTSSGVTIIN